MTTILSQSVIVFAHIAYDHDEQNILILPCLSNISQQSHSTLDSKGKK